ncbi:hypothetical protein NC652_004602 [Populus alba x Populus x berolinensis]|nr:hypothetical protein NC652_004602 [Populus alba x Populus x berolinensis]
MNMKGNHLSTQHMKDFLVPYCRLISQPACSDDSFGILRKVCKVVMDAGCGVRISKGNNNIDNPSLSILIAFPQFRDKNHSVMVP